jgi:anti-sigma B factor antagonist
MTRHPSQSPAPLVAASNGAPPHRDLPAPFNCVVGRDAQGVRLLPVGELDMATAPRLRETVAELRATGFDHLTLDLRRLCFIDSSGLRAILWLAADCRVRGSGLELIPGLPAVQRIFELTATLEHLPFRA